MPYLQISTNKALDKTRETELARAVSPLLASMLGKAENYIMIEVHSGLSMLFAGTADPLAYQLTLVVEPRPLDGIVDVTLRLAQPRALLRELRWRNDVRFSAVRGDGELIWKIANRSVALFPELYNEYSYPAWVETVRGFGYRWRIE